MLYVYKGYLARQQNTTQKANSELLNYTSLKRQDSVAINFLSLQMLFIFS